MPERGPSRPFSDRENDIADLIGNGFSYKEIGARLSPRIKASTVRKEVERMAWKFDAYHELRDGAHRAPREIVLIYAIYRKVSKSSPVFAAAMAATGPRKPGQHVDVA